MIGGMGHGLNNNCQEKNEVLADNVSQRQLFHHISTWTLASGPLL